MEPSASRLPHVLRGDATPETCARRWDQLDVDPAVRETLCDERTTGRLSAYARNIENAIGEIRVPLAVAGPLHVRGRYACGDFYVPLATTEAALVASYSRGAQLISEAGGCATRVIARGVSRAPVFVFGSIEDAATFATWCEEQTATFALVAATTTRHGSLTGTRATVAGRYVFLALHFDTGDAAGQNMVTIAAHAICGTIVRTAPVPIVASYVEGNFSSDKKATVQSLLGVRGMRVVADVELPAALVEERLHATPRAIASLAEIASVASALSGAIGAQAHYANGLAALYLACGQDVACVAESAIGVTSFTVTETGALQASVTLPNVIVGTVGGGTGLPSAAAALAILKLPAERSSLALAEIAAGLCLAGELSITAAMAANEFTSAHRRLARGA